MATGLLAVALVSCDGHRVINSPDNGVVWTRLTSTGITDCLWPDVRGDSLVYSASVNSIVGSNNGNPIFALRGRIIVSGIDGTKPYTLVQGGQAPWNSVRPRWAGRQKIMFQDNRPGTSGDSDYDIWSQRFEDLDEDHVTSFAGHEVAPAPRPNSPGLVYIELRAGAVSEYDFGRLVLVPDTTATPIERIYLTPDTLLCNDPDWDPTGNKLCFTVQNAQDATRHVYTMNLAPGDSLPTQITVGYSHDFHPRWSPDGGRIAFTTDRTGRWGVWIVNPIGEAQGLQALSFDDTGATVFCPAWTSDGTSLIVSSNGRGGVRSLWLLTNLPAFNF